MGWSLGFDEHWQRDIGYGVPAFCDHPHCSEVLDRGLSYVCGGGPYGKNPRAGRRNGCGLYFCEEHGGGWLCTRCLSYKPPYKRPKRDHPDWIKHKLTDPSWAEWREAREGR